MEISEIVIQSAAIIIAIVTFALAHFISAVKDRKTANREIYQQLELASIDLFRFEADHIDLTRPLWEKNTALPPSGSAERNALNNYVCQMLNLFEMAIRFRKEKVMPKDVFASWINWIFDLCDAPHFAEIWSDTRLNYISALREIIDAGVMCCDSDDEKECKEKFFTFISNHHKSREICLLVSELKKDI